MSHRHVDLGVIRIVAEDADHEMDPVVVEEGDLVTKEVEVDVNKDHLLEAEEVEEMEDLTLVEVAVDVVTTARLVHEEALDRI